jgi:hypothetical protein
MATANILLISTKIMGRGDHNIKKEVRKPKKVTKK